MRHIVPNIFSLMQHKLLFSLNPNYFKPPVCLACGSNKIGYHGCYWRKADRLRTGDGNLNPIPIPRFFCRHCRKTTSALPLCICPRRWYIWCLQQLVLLGFCYGNSIRKLSIQFKFSRKTISCWLNTWQLNFDIYDFHLKKHFPFLGYCSENFKTFWYKLLQHCSLAESMYILNYARVRVP